MADRTRREFTDADIAKIADTYHAWRGDEFAPSFSSSLTAGCCDSSPRAGEVADKPMGGLKESIQKKPYADIKGFCKSATLDEIKANDYVLTPGRYVGVAETHEDDEAFSAKMARLTAELTEQMTESAKLDAKIKENLAKITRT